MDPFDTAWNLLKELSDEDLEYAAQFGGLRDAANRYKGKMTEGEPGMTTEQILEFMRENRGKDNANLPIEDVRGKPPEPVEWPGGKGPPVTMGTIDRKGRHVMPKKVSTEQNIAQLLGGGQGEEPEPDKFTVDAPTASPSGRGNPSQEYWSDLFSGPMGGQGLDEGEASRAELEEGGLDEGEEADPDVRDSTFDTLPQEAPEPTLPSGEPYRTGHPHHEEPDALWPHEVHREREAQAHEGELDAMHAAMSAINPAHRSPIGHIPGLVAETSGHGQDIMDRAANRPEPMDQAMETLGDVEIPGRDTEGGFVADPESFHEDEMAMSPEELREASDWSKLDELDDEDPMEQAMSTLQESASDQQEDFDEAEDARQERNVQTQARVNPRGPPPAPGSANYEQNMAAWRAGQKKRGRR